MKFLFLFLLSFLMPLDNKWGFYAHKEINYHAVFTLPAELFGFYKANIEFIREEAVTPDKRRYVVKEEGARHYIDLDAYDSIPYMSYKKAIEIYGVDSILKHGILPWHLLNLRSQLTQAFKNKDLERILRLSADAGHYLADANVPLHTTKNYNGQFTNQEGIHGFWESRLPELFKEDYDLLTGRSLYWHNPEQEIWNLILGAHQAVDSVLQFEKKLSLQTPPDKKFSFEERGKSVVKVYAEDYARKYHKLLNGQVERQFRKAILATGSFWYTCWIEAGQPELPSVSVNELKDVVNEVVNDTNCNGRH